MTHTALPTSVQRQLDAAAVLEAQLYGQAPADPAVNTDAPQPAEDPSPAPVEPTPPEVQPAPQVEEETFRRRYEVLQSKYNAEVPRLHAQLREAVSNITQLTAEVQRLQQAAPQQAPTVPTDADDAERFGEDLLAVIDKRAAALAQRLADERVAQMTSKLNAMENQLQNVGERVVLTDQDRFYNTLAKRVPIS